jgi:peroxiredoxin
MNTALLLSILSLGSTAIAIARYRPKMKRNIGPLHPRFEQSMMVAAIGFALATFVSGPHVAAIIIAIMGALPALLFLVATETSGLPAILPALAMGTRAPDFAALDSSGGEVRLSDLRGSPLLVKFYRGYWCPYCIAELEQLAAFESRFTALGVKLVAISSDTVEELAKFRSKHDWNILLLADPDLAAHRLYNLAHRTFTPRRGPFRELAIPTSILIDADGRVLWYELARDFRVRPQADAILDLTRCLLRRAPGPRLDAQAA